MEDWRDGLGLGVVVLIVILQELDIFKSRGELDGC